MKPITKNKLGLLLLLLVGTTARGQPTHYWTGGSSGDYTNVANWSRGVVGGPIVAITNSGATRIRFPFET